MSAQIIGWENWESSAATLTEMGLASWAPSSLSAILTQSFPPPFNCNQTWRAYTRPRPSIINWLACCMCTSVWGKTCTFRKKCVRPIPTKDAHTRQQTPFQIHTADTPEEINMAENSGLFLTQRERENREDRSFVLGVAVQLWGSIGLTSRGLGLWSRKRHKREVSTGLNSLEMLYHHYQQGTVSHQGRKKLRGLRSSTYCMRARLCAVRGCVSVNAWTVRDKYYITVLGISLARWYRLIQPGICERPAESPLLLFHFCPPIPTRFKWSYQRVINLNRGKERRGQWRRQEETEAACWPVTL